MSDIVEPKGKVGRPAKKISLEEVERLAGLLYNRKQVCQMLGIGKSTFEHNPEVVEAYKRGEENVAHSVHAKQYQLAMNGNVEMLKILGKEFLGQTQGVDIRQRSEGVIVIINSEDKDL